ncbi:Ribosomal RNA large subunit methyltransferase K/L [Legionella massiliensis]|uniref:Ribosomal RNA large subunit methyltransferase K/L n=1 Tax=Legionella massiliensis TaxID=1034943 RepID=A0A078KWP9_9GAMM|nr:bifunctional 23S rRNA (guanine(2069)-N(7))-methyltransferase RlmK/23S rRNA (guanine(2445)-N(2))-methyltransferase RlmL [Legionella massiliensis]CDZ76153.1 Ribosomal RNA large subunit methyltransferase K/L [Legionella massiliensis]CEE11891.1 Ribosomal RNA large subunit methyltransferase K/L [Legionella massiliensis]
MNYSLFISCPKGLEYLLEDEVKALGFHVSRVSPQGVYGQAELAMIYHLCLWTRLANRVQLILFSGEAHNEQTLYQLANQFPWQTVFTADKSLAIEFHGSSDHIRNSMFGAQVIKDGIVDHFRSFKGMRPTIDRGQPDIRLHAHLKNDQVTVSLDLTGYSLHQRGYRTQAGEAPLKENIAAAMLIRAKWPQLAAEGYVLHDPFCGAGTLVIEAAMMAGHIAPGLLRHDQALIRWAQHQPSLWDKVRAQALQQVKPIKLKLLGTDNNPKLINIARDNAERAGVLPLVEFANLSVKDCRPANEKGLVIANPPYGERLGDATQLVPLYHELGTILHSYYQGWHAAILTSNPMLAKAIGLRAEKQYTLFNGALECKLYCLTLNAENQLKNAERGHFSSAAQMLANRLKKNHNHLQKWAKRSHINCYRVYDADLPEYAFAIDIYNDYAVLQEYAAPASIAAHKVEKRSLDVIQVVPAALGISADKLVVKQRKQQKGSSQYQKMSQTRHNMTVVEGQAKLKVNLYDYLDTGLFLDHRPLRMRFAQLKSGQRFLNCFCYTASASVHAALAGAITTNVDLSKTYLSWSEDNFRLNHIDLSRHQFIHFDCLEWLQITSDRFDVIFLDPPSFSNSKRMKQTLDVQRDHIDLINAAMRLLNAKGVLYFSTNLRQFKLSPEISQKYKIEDISAETIDLDFKRSKRIHQCYMITQSSN